MASNEPKPLTPSDIAQTPQESITSIIEKPSEKILKERKRFKTVFIVLILLFALLVTGIVGYHFYQSRKAQKTNPSPELSLAQNPNNEDLLGLTAVSFLSTPEETYLKLEVSLYDPGLEYGRGKVKKFYTQQVDQTYEPVEVEETAVPPGNWTELLREPINKPADGSEVLLMDRLFSFKKIPGTNNFLFVIELEREPKKPSQESLETVKKWERVLYLYNDQADDEKLTKIQVFDKESFEYSFPKIDTFSPEERYVSIYLFGCWNCGGPQPLTYLLDTQTLKTKNLGQVSYFQWQDNGSYNYKDYLVIECEREGPGDCIQDPETLPLKTGRMN